MKLSLPVLPLCLLAAVFVPTPADAGNAGRTPGEGRDCRGAPLVERHVRFLDEAALLLEPEDVELFRCLGRDYQRDAFIEAFWRARDPYPETARNELRESWEERLLEARQRYPDLEDVRARYRLLNGPPSLEVRVCPEQSSTRVETWFYGFASLAEVRSALFEGRLRRDQTAVVFFVPWGAGREGRWRVWRPSEPLSAVSGVGVEAAPRSPEAPGSRRRPGLDPPASSARTLGAGCDRDALELAVAVIETISRQGGRLGFLYERLLAERLEPAEPPRREWRQTFASYRTDLDPDAPPLAVDTAVDFPGHRGQRTVVQILASVDPSSAAVGTRGATSARSFELLGEVLADGPEGPVLFDSFRARYRFPVAPTADAPSPVDRGAAAGAGADEAAAEALLPLVVERALRPGDYRLVLKVEDLEGPAQWRDERPLRVPRVEARGDPSPEVAAALADANALLGGGDPEVRILPPRAGSGGLLEGYVRFEALVAGPVDRLRFLLDERELLVRREPPWTVDLDLGRLPRERALRVVALDSEGRQIASDALVLNASPQRFAVRILSPAPDRRGVSSVRAKVRVDLPDDAALDRVELHLGDRLAATLFRPPFVQPLRLDGRAPTVLRAVAHLADGRSLEDAVIVNGPPGLERVEVDFVELYTTVHGRDGRPLEGLERGDFTVTENGVPQQVARFGRVDDTPLSGAVLLDVSASMEERLDDAAVAAARFLGRLVQPRDRFSVISFNDRPHAVTGLTNDLDALGRGLLGLRAERGTALWDSLIFAMHQLNGLSGQRAVLLLTDGEDEHSRFGFEETLEYVGRAQATLYVVGIDLPRKGPDNPRKQLERLAAASGGRAFFLDGGLDAGLEGLDAVYDTIADELRSRYFIAYQSEGNEGDGFREIEVDVARRGAEVRTLSGYFP